MTLIRTRVRIAKDRKLTGIVPAGTPVGEHEVVIALVSPPRLRVADLPVHPSGWDDGVSLRREELYGDDGR